LHVVLMVGGSGTRFWPVSREATPKYLLPIVGEQSMLAQTVGRIAPMVDAQCVFCITSSSQAPSVCAALPHVPRENIIAEPMGRDSAACIALAATIINERDPDAVMLCMPGDSLVKDADKFRETVRTAELLALMNKLVTFGIKPASPETRFGYILRGEQINLPGAPAAYQVAEFVEKPDRASAERMVADGRYYWNSGNFVWRADVILKEFERLAPAHFAAMQKIRAKLKKPQLADTIRAEYERLPKISIDYAVMEKAEDVAVVEAAFDWDDVGAWTALEKHLSHDECGNTCIGNCVPLDTKGCVISTDANHLVAAVGLEDMIIVHTSDATLVCPKGRAEDVKKLVDELRRRGFEAYL